MCSTPEVVADDEEPGDGQPCSLACGRLRHGPQYCSGGTTPRNPPNAALDRLAKAIDELAADSRDGTASPQLAERIARLWTMVGDLDPELAKRRAAYERTEIPDV